MHTDDLINIGSAAADQIQAEQGKRLGLEQRLISNETNHYRAITDAQRDQDRLRDRLATADVRLSVLLAEDPAGCSSVPTASGAGGVVHGKARAQLDPTHAQRIIAITDDGDRAVIKLAACQAYAKSVSTLNGTGD
ncbi:lysis protein [Pseudomonas sp. Z3-8]|uniref:lysis protein n=1 Tax=Pseudomonas sp. Z3-8 TaxID=2817412 RepID=UPI003DAA27B3